MPSLDFHRYPEAPKSRNRKRFFFDAVFVLLLISIGGVLALNFWQRHELEKLKSSFRPNSALKRSFFLLEKNIAASILDSDQPSGLPMTNFSKLSGDIPEEDSADLILANKGSDLEQGLLALSHLKKTIADTSIPPLQKIESAKGDCSLIVKAWQNASDPSLPVLLETQQSMKSMRDLCQLFLQHVNELETLLGKNEIQRWLVAFPDEKKAGEGVGVELLFDEGKIISKKSIAYVLQGPPSPLPLRPPWRSGRTGARGDQTPDALEKYWLSKVRHSLDFIVVISQDALGQFLSLNETSSLLDRERSSQDQQDVFYPAPFGTSCIVSDPDMRSSKRCWVNSQILEYIGKVLENPRTLFRAIMLGGKIKLEETYSGSGQSPEPARRLLH